MDAEVDKSYKKKYFPARNAAVKPAQGDANATIEPTKTVLGHARRSSQASLTSMSDLIHSFSSLAILPAAAGSIEDGEESKPALSLPCPISNLPSEVLIEILFQIALLDFGILGRLAQVCKRFAFLIAVEDRIWQRLCCGPEVGFGGMHYSWTCDFHGHRLDDSEKPSLVPPTFIPIPLSPLYPTYRNTLRHRPRVRFNGCYISTVNYVRSGAAPTTQVTFNTPIHIVTYYRYLRFFRDGTVVSLVSTHEPIEIVHHLTKDNLPFRQKEGSSGRSRAETGSSGSVGSGGNLIGSVGGSSSSLPSTVFQHAVHGRWRLTGCPVVTSPPSSKIDVVHEREHGCTRDRFLTNTNANTGTEGTGIGTGTVEPEGDIHIQTEGLDTTYTFAMHLSIRSSSTRSSASSLSSSTKTNNKLVWQSFWSHNRVTDVWHDLPILNDRPFIWSRVKSYGMG